MGNGVVYIYYIYITLFCLLKIYDYEANSIIRHVPIFLYLFQRSGHLSLFMSS